MSNTSDGTSVMVQGRIVWTGGDIFAGSLVTDFNTKQPVLDAEGNQKREWSLGIAVPKDQLSNDPANIWAAMHGEAAKIFPQGLPPDFAMKYKDGDGVDHNGKPFGDRTGYAGCMVFSLSTRIKPSFFRYEGGQNVLVNDGIKCGDYVNVQVGVKAHGPVGRGKAGLYMNLYAVQLVGYGEEIINKPSGNNIFGQEAPSVPQGASATPLAPQGGMPAMPSAPQTAPASAQQPVAPQPMQAPAPQAAPQPAAPVAPVAQPHHGVLPPAHQPAAPVAQPAAPAAPVQGGMPMPPGFGQQ